MGSFTLLESALLDGDELLGFDYDAPRTWAEGDRMSALRLDTEIRDRMRNTFAGRAEARGDLFRSARPHEIVRIPIGAEGALFKAHPETGRPQWFGSPAVLAWRDIRPPGDEPVEETLASPLTAWSVMTTAGGEVSIRAVMPGSGAAFLDFTAYWLAARLGNTGPGIPEQDRTVISLRDDDGDIAGTIVEPGHSNLVLRDRIRFYISGYTPGQVRTFSIQLRRQSPSSGGGSPPIPIIRYGGEYGPVGLRVVEA